MEQRVKSGIINLYKEPGMTSFAAVARVRRILGIKKTGHAGTLDPAAEGVLPICFGKATRTVAFLGDETKTYRAVLRLGVETDTQDLTGTVLCGRPVTCTEDDVRRALDSFTGPQLQTPPMYSAKKVGGQRLYTIAREGRSVERRPAPVTFYRITPEKIDLAQQTVIFETVCSKGAYIRTLCADLGERLGCGGAMEHLLRTRVGRFGMEDAVRVEELQAAAEEGRLSDLVCPVDALFEADPAWQADPAADALLINGVKLDGRNAGQFAPMDTDMRTDAAHGGEDGVRIRMYLSDGRFMGIYRMRADGIPVLEQNFFEEA